MEGAVFSNVFLRAALFLGAAVFVVGFANAQLSSVANPESMGTELLSAWHHGSDEQDDVNAKSAALEAQLHRQSDRKSTRLNSSHVSISYAVFCLKIKK